MPDTLHRWRQLWLLALCRCRLRRSLPFIVAHDRFLVQLLPWTRTQRELAEANHAAISFALAVSQGVQVVRPRLHHPHALRPVFGGMDIRPSHIVSLLVRELTLNGVGVPEPHLVQSSGCHCAKTMRGHLLRAVTKAT